MLVQSLQRQLNFPRDLGRLYTCESGSPKRFLAQAHGAVDVPPGVSLQLQISPEACEFLSAIENVDASAITALDFEGCTIPRKQAQYIAHLRNLRELNFSHCELFSESLEFIEKLHDLRVLRLMWCPVGNQAAKHIGSAPRLEILDLSRTYISAAALDDLKSIRSLRQLILLDLGIGQEKIAEFCKQRTDVAVTH